jgi:peptidoglycan hydrolase-like protein with peptidoglycan-binding domain
MLRLRACLSFLLLTALAAGSALASRTHRAPTSGHRHHKVSVKLSKRHHFVPGQRGIDSDRARQIQTALIQQHYMTGTPSGQWDAQTESAMQKYQADHGWQTKLTPDSRAIIMLGLGPQKANPIQSAPKPATGLPGNPAISESNTLASTHSIQN